MDDLDEEFVEIIAAVGPRRRGQIVAAAHALAGDIRADADKLGTAAIHPPSRTRLKVLGLLPQQTFGQSRFWRYQLAAAAEATRATLTAGERACPPAARVKKWSST